MAGDAVDGADVEREPRSRGVRPIAVSMASETIESPLHAGIVRTAPQRITNPSVSMLRV